jgi:hypothetical protein
MNTRSLSPNLLDGYPDQRLPQVLVLDIADLLNDFCTEWNHVLTYQSRSLGFTVKPSIGHIVEHVIESIQQEKDAELELASMAYNDIASLAHVNYNDDDDQVEVEQYTPLHLGLSNATVRFGKQVIQRFKNERLYHYGYFPYKFKCQVGSTVAVEYVNKSFNPTLVTDYCIRKGDNFNVSIDSVELHIPDI